MDKGQGRPQRYQDQEKIICFSQLQPNAELPYKENSEAASHNLTLISRTESRSEDNHGEVNLFNTGLVITSIPKDMYLELVAHPSLYKHGYILTGPIVIDCSTKGEIIIPLYKYNDSEDIELPFPGIQFTVKEKLKYFISSDEVKRKEKEEYRPQFEYISGKGGSSSSKGGSSSSSKGGKSKANHMF